MYKFGTVILRQINVPMLYIDQNVFILVTGLFLVLPFVDTYVSVDLRTSSYDIPPQEVRYNILRYVVHLYRWITLSSFVKKLITMSGTS